MESSLSVKVRNQGDLSRQGRVEIARRFNAGFSDAIVSSPEGTAEMSCELKLATAKRFPIYRLRLVPGGPSFGSFFMHWDHEPIGTRSAAVCGAKGRQPQQSRTLRRAAVSLRHSRAPKVVP